MFITVTVLQYSSRVPRHPPCEKKKHGGEKGSVTHGVDSTCVIKKN